MRVAIVAGFFEPVRKAILDKFKLEHEIGTVIWIPQKGPLQPPDLHLFNSRLFDVLTQGADSVLILLAKLRGKEWVQEKVNQSILQAKARFDSRTIECLLHANAQDSKFIAEKIQEFGPSQTRKITQQTMQVHVGSQKILCVRSENNSPFKSVLARDGFAEVDFDAYFEELILKYDAHPDEVENCMNSHPIILYACHGLSHATETGLVRYKGRIFKQSLPRECVVQLRIWLSRSRREAP